MVAPIRTSTLQRRTEVHPLKRLPKHDRNQCDDEEHRQLLSRDGDGDGGEIERHPLCGNCSRPAKTTEEHPSDRPSGQRSPPASGDDEKQRIDHRARRQPNGEPFDGVIEPLQAESDKQRRGASAPLRSMM